MPDPNVYEIIK